MIATALSLLEKLYVHLPLKRAMYAVNPLQRLKLLRRRISYPKVAPVSDQQFFIEMLSIFSELRDLHTNFILPEPFRSSTAFLPFRIEECIEDEQPIYLVSHIMAPDTAAEPESRPKDRDFVRGVVVTHWNGMPIDRAVAINAHREAGSNVAARHAQGLASLTIRWMGMSLPPDEEWVDITYLPLRKRAGPKTVRFRWEVFRPKSNQQLISAASGEKARYLGLDARAEIERQIRRFLFSTSRRGPRGEPAIDAAPDFASVFPANRNVVTRYGTFAYVRITTFNVPDDEEFVQEFIRITSQLSPDGLILDVRENGGGLITAGERLLQALTPKRIDPARLHFVNSTMTLQLCERHDFIKPWSPSIAQAVETGAEFSQGLPLFPDDQYNDIGQKYQGPVVLVTDALCYSTTDIFAAGFQDHGIGKILGVHDNTGAGGANVWDYSLIAELVANRRELPRALPNDASFRFAVRRVTRVGTNAGVPIEDLGVEPDVRHRMTRRDILERNVDLINAAARLLSKEKKYRLRGEKTRAGACRVTAKNIDRLDVYLDDRPFGSFPAAKASIDVALPKQWGGAKEARLFGFDGGKLAVATRVRA